MPRLRHVIRPLEIPTEPGPDRRPLLPGEQREAFAAAPCQDIRQRGQPNLPYRSLKSRLATKFLSVYNICGFIREHVGLGRCFGSHIIACPCHARLGRGGNLLQQTLIMRHP